MSRPKNDLARLIKAANEQLDLAKMLRASLLTRAKHGAVAASKKAEAWQPDDSWRADFNSATQAIDRAGKALKDAMDARAKQLATMSVEELEAQFISELKRAAPHFSRDTWDLLDKIRMKQVVS